jgi:urea transport system ATP-binding protein
MHTATLEMTDVHVGYGRTTVVHGATIEVPLGEVTAVMGHNGAGKTTLLRAAVGLLQPRAGRIVFDGEDITRIRPSGRVKRGLGYVPQGQQCFPQLTTQENLQLVADTRRGGNKLIAEMLDLFPALGGLLARFPVVSASNWRSPGH